MVFRPKIVNNARTANGGLIISLLSRGLVEQDSPGESKGQRYFRPYSKPKRLDQRWMVNHADGPIDLVFQFS
jgi:hypothetical protein